MAKVLVANIFMFNVLHIVAGLVALGLTFAQFADIGLDNNYIDFRLLNSFHAITGAVGIYMVVKNYGSIVAQSLYCITLTLGAFTVGFYADAFYEAYDTYRLYVGYQQIPDNKGEFDQMVKDQMGKLVICAIMIALGLIELLAGLASTILLQYLASDTGPPADQSKQLLKNRARVAYVASMKIIFACAAMALGNYLEFLYKKSDKYTRVAMDKLAASTVLVSGILDVVASCCARHHVLNLKVTMSVSIGAAVLCIKALDYMVVGYFVKDLNDYTAFDPLTQKAEMKQEKFIKFVVHACDLGCLVLLFIHCVIATLEAGSNVERLNAMQAVGLDAKNELVTTNLQLQRNCLGVLQFLWGAGLIALCVISFVPNWEFTRGYTGTSVLWVGCLFVASGSVSSVRLQTLCASVYVFSIVCCVVAIEYLAYSLNMIYQAVTNEQYRNEGSETLHTGRIILYAVQAGLLLLEFITALPTAIHFGKIIRWTPVQFVPYYSSNQKFIRVISGVHFLYAASTIAVVIAAEVATFHYNVYSVPTFVKYTNGMVVLAVACVQLWASSNHKFLLPCSLLNIISAGITYFVLAPTISALYMAVFSYRAEWPGSAGPSTGENRERQQLALAIILVNAYLVLLVVVEYAVSIFSALICSYLMHHYYAISDQNFATLRSTRDSTNGVLGMNGNGHIRDGLTEISLPRAALTADRPKSPKRAAAHLPRYFGDDYRTYSQRMDHQIRDDYHHANGNGVANGGTYVPGPFYGVSNGYLPRTDNYAQTNIRHVFRNKDLNGNGYTSAYGS